MSDPTTVSRRLVAVFAADVEGYSRLMGADEVGTLKGLAERREITRQAHWSLGWKAERQYPYFLRSQHDITLMLHERGNAGLADEGEAHRAV